MKNIYTQSNKCKIDEQGGNWKINQVGIIDIEKINKNINKI